MKTAVSIPDATFNRAEGLARRLGISRSKLYARALDTFMSGEQALDVTAAMDAAIAGAGIAGAGIAGAGGEPQPVDFSRAAARRVLERSEW